MKFISHRGNISSINEDRENSESYILEAISQGFDVEIDVWFHDNSFFLGHDNAQFKTSIDFLINPGLWIHCKTIKTLYRLHNINKSFFHYSEKVVLTSNNILWTYIGEELTPDSICVLPELSNYPKEKLMNCYGICSNIIKKYKDELYTPL